MDPLLPAFAWRRLAAGLLAALCSMHAFADDDDPPGRVGRLAQTWGIVRSFEGDSGWIDATRNAPLSTGDRLATDRDGRAWVQVGSSSLRLGPDSELIVARLDDERVRLRLDHGAVTLHVRATDVVGEFSIETADGFFVPRQPGLVHLDIEAGHTVASVFTGRLEFEGRDRTDMFIEAGQAAEYWREGAQQVTHYRWVDMPDDNFTRWAQAEDRQEDRYAQPAYAPPEMTGAGELDRYGRWQATPDYGPVWVPTTVPVGWAPYRDGQWLWNPPWGWTWVDSMPWGFAPFHYGRWCWWNSRWAWVPGQPIGRPAFAPALVGWIGGPGYAVSINGGAPPAVGWVPLAPYEPFYPAYAVTPNYWHRVNGPVAYPSVKPAPGTPIAGHSTRLVPIGPIGYVNRGVHGAVTVLPAPLPTPRQPIGRLVRPADPVFLGQAGGARGVVQAPPPPPPGRGHLTPSAPTMEVSASQPRLPEPRRTVMPVLPPRPAQPVTPPAMPATPTAPSVQPRGPQTPAPAPAVRPNAPPPTPAPAPRFNGGGRAPSEPERPMPAVPVAPPARGMVAPVAPQSTTPAPAAPPTVRAPQAPVAPAPVAPPASAIAHRPGLASSPSADRREPPRTPDPRARDAQVR